MMFHRGSRDDEPYIFVDLEFQVLVMAQTSQILETIDQL